MADPNQTDVGLGRSRQNKINCPTRIQPSPQESLPKQRLIQSSHRKSRLFRFVFVIFLYGEAVVPGAILVAVAVGRFADNRSPPKSRRANAVSICWKAPSRRRLAGTKVASDPRQRQENTEGTLEPFLELESE